MEECQTRNHDGSNRARAGFTLLELIVVIFLISLIAAMVIPSFYGMSENKLKSDARRLASLLRYLNDNAISMKETYSLKFDLQEKTLSWKEAAGRKTETFEDLIGVYLPSKGEVKEGQITVFFGPLGLQESIAVHLRREGRGMTVALNPWSGRTRVIEDEK